MRMRYINLHFTFLRRSMLLSAMLLSAMYCFTVDKPTTMTCYTLRLSICRQHTVCGTGAGSAQRHGTSWMCSVSAACTTSSSAKTTVSCQLS